MKNTTFLPDFELRRVTESSLSALLELYRSCEDFLALGPESLASQSLVLNDLRHSAAEGGIYCGIFDPDGKLLGVVDWIPAGFEGRSDQAFLSLLMIAPAYRGIGLGEAVVRRVEDEICAGQGVTAMLSAVQVNNPGAIRFWKRMGYNIVSSPSKQPDGTVTYLLKKLIDIT